MKLDNLHPDIKSDLEKMGRKPVEVIDPSPGLWGGEPRPGLVSILYECRCNDFTHLPPVHTHQALYGPTGPGSEGLTLYAD